MGMSEYPGQSHSSWLFKSPSHSVQYINDPRITGNRQEPVEIFSLELTRMRTDQTIWKCFNFLIANRNTIRINIFPVMDPIAVAS